MIYFIYIKLSEKLIELVKYKYELEYIILSNMFLNNTLIVLIEIKRVHHYYMSILKFMKNWIQLYKNNINII